MSRVKKRNTSKAHAAFEALILVVVSTGGVPVQVAAAKQPPAAISPKAATKPLTPATVAAREKRRRQHAAARATIYPQHEVIYLPKGASVSIDGAKTLTRHHEMTHLQYRLRRRWPSARSWSMPRTAWQRCFPPRPPGLKNPPAGDRWRHLLKELVEVQLVAG